MVVDEWVVIMRVLVVSKFFPPAGGARALQMGKVVNALVDAGCEIEVVTGFEHGVVDTPDWPYPVHYVPCEAKSSAVPLWPIRLERIAVRLMKKWLGRDWIHMATKVCLDRCRQFRPNVILSASNPRESHMVGLWLQRKAKLPWIAFFSDPWPGQLLPEPYRIRRNVISEWHDMNLVCKTLRRCDAVVMTTRYGIQWMQMQTGINFGQKAFVVPHIGCPRMPLITPVKPVLAHIGDLYRRASRALIEAVVMAKRLHTERFGGLLCVGSQNDEFRALVRDYEAEDYVSFMEYVCPDEASRIAQRSQALLVVEADMQLSPFLPSKFVNYSFAMRPILAITPKRSAIRDYLTTFGGGIAVSHDADEIADAIGRIFSNDLFKPDAGLIRLQQQFQSSTVARSYVDIFEMVRRQQVQEKG